MGGRLVKSRPELVASSGNTKGAKGKKISKGFNGLRQIARIGTNNAPITKLK
jgi:hypothetical protein